MGLPRRVYRQIGRNATKTAASVATAATAGQLTHGKICVVSTRLFCNPAGATGRLNVPMSVPEKTLHAPQPLQLRLGGHMHQQLSGDGVLRLLLVSPRKQLGGEVVASGLRECKAMPDHGPRSCGPHDSPFH